MMINGIFSENLVKIPLVITISNVTFQEYYYYLNICPWNVYTSQLSSK